MKDAKNGLLELAERLCPYDNFLEWKQGKVWDKSKDDFLYIVKNDYFMHDGIVYYHINKFDIDKLFSDIDKIPNCVAERLGFNTQKNLF